MDHLFWSVWRNEYLLQHIFQWNRPLTNRYSGDMAVRLRYKKILKTPYIKLIFTPRATNIAAAIGDIELLECLHQRIDGMAMDVAAIFGNLKTLRWFYEHHTEGCTPRAMNFACSRDPQYRLVTFNKQFGEDVTEQLQRYEKRHLRIVRFLHDHCAGCTTIAMDLAAEIGHLSVVQFLHENRTEGCTTYAMDCAAARGHLDIVKFLHYNRSEGCTSRAFTLARFYGHYEIYNWLCQNIELENEENWENWGN
jgi:hypothetical protein